MFVGREQELRFFEGRYGAPGGQLVVLYGRRRVGKTEVLRQFCDGRPHVFYSCREISDAKQLAAFSERVLGAGSPAAKYISAFPDWEAAFAGILELPSKGEKRLLVIDEFPYMCRANPSIPSILQILWDERLCGENVMIVLCGSAMSFIEKRILSEKNPLYGRATGIYKLGELPFWDAVKFFPDYSDEDKMLAYAILGGIPHYLRQFAPSLSLRENIVGNVLAKGCALYSEVEFLIRQELRELALYNTLIEAVALGNTRMNDIYTKTLLDRAKISVYLKNLIELRILEREFSVLSSEKERAASTRGLYRIADNFFRFWFRFVFANLSDLEAGDAEGVLARSVLPQLNDFASPVFEAVCREFMRGRNRRNELPFRASTIGRWWGRLNKSVAEIDILAADSQSQNYILCECKFRNSAMGISDYERLREKSAVAKNGAAARYALFSKSGFAEGLAARAASDGESLELFSISDVVGGRE
jgi:AAA+ ATPase superfamily predicted ATPase